MNHKFVKAEWDAAEAKKKAGKDGLGATSMSGNMNANQVKDAVRLLLDAEGIEYLP